jgi:hypothetical protein
MVVFSAARADQVAGALPRAQRPAFSYLMLGALRGWADAPGHDGKRDGAVTAAEAERYVARQLRGFPGRTQVPDRVGDANFRLVAGARESAPDLRSSPTVAPTRPVYVPKATKTEPVRPQPEPARPKSEDQRRVAALLEKGYKPKKIIGRPLTESEIKQTVATKQFGFLSCGDRSAGGVDSSSGKRRPERVSGSVNMAFWIRPDGHLHNISVRHVGGAWDYRGTAFGTCMLGYLKELKFRPTSATKDVRADYTVFFKAK